MIVQNRKKKKDAEHVNRPAVSRIKNHVQPPLPDFKVLVTARLFEMIIH